MAFKEQIALDIFNGWNEQEVVEFDPSKTINMRILSSPGSRSGKCFVPREGLSPRINFGGNRGGRGLYVFKDSMYGIIGEEVYLIQKGLGHSPVGRLNTAAGHVGISNNDKQLMFVDGIDGWGLDITTLIFQKITSAGFPANASAVDIIGGRFITNEGDTGKFYPSGINDVFDWDANRQAQMEANPDVIVGFKYLNNRLWILGQETTEPWYNAGYADFPFRIDEARVLPYGCAAVGSIAKGNGYVCWLSSTEDGVGSVVLTRGAEPVIVSSAALEKELHTYQNISDATSYIFKNEVGQIFYILNFTTDSKSWAFLINSQLPIATRWFQMAYKDDNRYLGNNHAFFYGKHYVLDYDEPILYELSKDYRTDNEVGIRLSRVTKVLRLQNYEDLILNRLRFVMKQGTGTSIEKNIEPKIELSVSVDSGLTFGKVLKASVGKIGENTYITDFYNLGHTDEFVLKFEFYHDVPFAILDCVADISYSKRTR